MPSPACTRSRILLLLPAVVLLGLCGCASFAWPRLRAAISPEITKDQLVARLNANILGNDRRPGLTGYQATNASIRATGIPIALPAMLAVEAPRNFRLVVSRPLGGQEIDLGSNRDGFWIWTNAHPNEIMTASHEDIPLALDQLQFPIPIHPDWLMEVFGVVPLDEREFRLEGPTKAGQFELVALRESPIGEDVERVIRVDMRSGRISSHVLRRPGGNIIAVAYVDYAKSPKGVELPVYFKLRWPDARMEMSIDLRNPLVNAPALAENSTLWNVPSLQGAQVVDIGRIARQRAGALARKDPELPAAAIELPDLWQKPFSTVSTADGQLTIDAPVPAGWIPDFQFQETEDSRTFEWAQPGLKTPVTPETSGGQRSPYF